MSFFNEKQRKAMEDGEYICSECGKLMEFEDEWEETLVWVPYTMISFISSTSESNHAPAEGCPSVTAFVR